MKHFDTLVSWQNIPSILQAAPLRRVAEESGVRVIVVTDTDLSAHRIQLGWRRPEFSPAQLIVCPTHSERAQLVETYGRPSVVHIFTGISGFPLIYRSLKAVCTTPATVGAFLEPGRTDDGWRALARRARYLLHAARWGRRLSFVLATGVLAEEYYASCGFPRARIFPFGYFVESMRERAHAEHSSRENHGNVVQLLFVGELVPRKGIAQLFQALKDLKDLPWHLHVIGSGPSAASLAALSSRLTLSSRVSWLGPRENVAARAAMGYADVLVLPSLHDGWGAVINEALLTGTRVLASTACGASELVRERWRGSVFRANDIADLRNRLATLILDGPLSIADRARVAQWAERAISPSSASHYLLEVIEHVLGRSTTRPTAPWRQI